ncbi:hypothetical protein LCGC14_0738920 [marine sediment metagenome]|uniref:Uncharacterized protein n=1 Tax=marine sediment metagenome TaxID=412755 RepID=A0A0F9QSE3_9ZZZZ
MISYSKNRLGREKKTIKTRINMHYWKFHEPKHSNFEGDIFEE